MKLNKKIVCIAAAAAMSVSAVCASAASVPVPASNNQAFEYAESFYYDGLYYEAMEELNMVNPAVPDYDGNKVAAWKGKVSSAISRMEIANLLNQIKELNEVGDYYGAAAVIDALNARTDTTMSDYYSISYWEGVIAKKIAALVNGPVSIVRTGEAAVNRVKAAGYELASEYEWYSPVKVDGGYHVYIKTQLPGGGSADVAAFVVTSDGVVTRSF